MEEDQEHEQQKHVCKYCDKQFPCGRSLGGHMRSHMRNEKTHKDCGGSNNSNCNSYLVDVGYGLRENPKKTWRLSDSVDDCFKLCKECGKGFQSWKALCGHMRCHSERERVFQSDSFEDEEEDDDSWNHKLIMDSHSDTETAAAPRRRKRSRRTRYNNKNTTTTTTVTVSSCLSFANASTCVSEIEHEQEEVAICLMMLSRDVGYWGGVGFNSLAESSDNNSSLVNQNCNVDKKLKGVSRIGFKKPMGDEEEGFEVSNVQFGKSTVKCTEAEAEIEMGEESWKKLKCHGIDSPSKSRYQCTACNKTFHSYQALGGHRASHKRMKGCFVSKTENGETSIDNNSSPESKLIKSSPIERERPSCGEASYAAKKNKHECPVCHKVFASGQALGGHKRSHVLEASEARLNQSIVVQKQLPEIRDLLDLNLPAPDEEDTTTTALIEFKPWWIGNSHQHGPAVGMIFN